MVATRGPRATGRTRTGPALVAAAGLLLLAACDIPTQTPALRIQPRLRVPLLAEKTFVLLGPSDTGYEALVDTTDQAFDSLLVVQGDGTLLLQMDRTDQMVEAGPETLPAVSLANPTPIGITRAQLPGPVEYAFDLDNRYVSFDAAGDYVTLSQGWLVFDEVVNGFDAPFRRIVVRSPDVLVAGSPLSVEWTSQGATPGSISFPGLPAFGVRMGDRVDLAGARVEPALGRVRFTIEAQPSVPSGQLQPPAGLVATRLRFEGMRLGSGRGSTPGYTVRVSGDGNGDGRMNLDDPDERFTYEVGRLSEIGSADLGGFRFTGASLDVVMRTSVDADFVAYAAVVGESASGVRWLAGAPGSVFSVSPSDSLADAFFRGGASVAAANLIRIPVTGETCTRAGPERVCTYRFDATTTSIIDFLSAFPTRVDAAVAAVLAPGGGSFEILDGFRLSLDLSASVPISFGAPFSYTERVEADLSDVEDVSDPDADVRLLYAGLEFRYRNGLPFGLSASIRFLDRADRTVLELPRPGESTLSIVPAQVDAGGLSAAPTQGVFVLDVTREELEAVSNARFVELTLSLEPGGPQGSRVRADDTITVAGVVVLQVDASTEVP